MLFLYIIIKIMLYELYEIISTVVQRNGPSVLILDLTKVSK